MNTKQLKVRLHPNTHKEVKLMAAIQEKSMNGIINQAIREFIIKHQKENKYDHK